MHQSHNIPWHIFPIHFQFIHPNRSVTPHRTDLFPRNLPTQAGDLNHFTNKLVATIHEFAKTERAKYPEKIAIPASGKIYPDALRDRYPEYLNETNQLLENWFYEGYFNSGHGGFADVVKILVIENELQALLMLVQHPKVPFTSLRSLSWGHGFGFERVAEAIDPYIYFNVLDAMDLLAGGEYKELDSYKDLMRSITPHMDHDAQQVPHWAFIDEHNKKSPRIGEAPFDDYAAVREYLKKLFAIIYRYQVLLSECGLDHDWASDTVCQVKNWSKKALEIEVTEHPGQLKYRFG
jgi:hypothetical protein